MKRSDVTLIGSQSSTPISSTNARGKRVDFKKARRKVLLVDLLKNAFRAVQVLGVTNPDGL